MSKEKSLMTTHEVSMYLNLRESRIRYLVFNRLIPFIKIGRSILFPRADIDCWLNAQADFDPQVWSLQDIKKKIARARKIVRKGRGYRNP
jgi:excisionase family DNA binding protein